MSLTAAPEQRVTAAEMLSERLSGAPEQQILSIN